MSRKTSQAADTLSPAGGRWFRVYQAEAYVLNPDAPIGLHRGVDLRVWWAMLDRMSYGNRVTVSQAELAEALKVPASSVSRSQRRLAETHLIVPLTRQTRGRPRIWLVNPEVAFKGDEMTGGRSRCRKEFRTALSGLRVVE